MIGVMMLWQTVGLELACSPPVTCWPYLEVLTAVSMMTAQAQLAPVQGGDGAARDGAHATVAPFETQKSGARRIRPKTPPSSSDADGTAGVWRKRA